jgi:kynurenine 3-monooxygenase
MEILDATGDDWDAALPRFSALLKPEGDAIATLALENFVEMREKVADPAFVHRKKVEAALARAFPDEITPAYTMVTFRPGLPYSEALRRSRAQDRVLDRLVADERVKTLLASDPSSSTLRGIFAEVLPLLDS